MTEVFRSDDALAFGGAGRGSNPASASRSTTPNVSRTCRSWRPRHPRVIAEKSGAAHAMGRHPTAYSIVLPVPADALEASPAFRALQAELSAAPFGPKIAWHMLDRRRERLHATLCGGLGSEPPAISAQARAALASLGPVAVELRGPFSGSLNHGWLYLRACPERRAGVNLFHAVQQAFGHPVTDLYVVGIWNLTDDLDAAETSALAAFVARWWPRVVLRFEARDLWPLGARDDLVLDGEVVARLPLA